jgi:hypothetical protein
MTCLRAIIAWLRDATWLNARRAVAYSKIALIMFGAIAGGWIFGSDGLVDPLGKPLGADFVSFWAASSIALNADPAAVYDQERHGTVEQQAIGREIPYYAWFYPPVFLLIVLPLALFPYALSLTIWLAATAAGYVAVIRRMLPFKGVLWAALGFPAALVNVMNGQNAFLSVALLGGGVALLDRRPMVAGTLLGVMGYKPQLACLVPLALLASGRWKAMGSAMVTLVVLTGVSFALFGRITFVSFFATAHLAQRALEDGLVEWSKMQSVFASIRLLGGSSGFAYAAQLVFAAAATLAVIRVWRAQVSTGAKAAVLATASVLFSPFLLDYDLVLLAIPIAWLVNEGIRSGFAPWEKALLGSAWLDPLIARSIAGRFHLAPTPLICSLVLIVTWRRAMASAAEASRGIAISARFTGRVS